MQTLSCLLLLVFCDFENDDVCGYVNDDDNDIDWDRRRGRNEFTGPFVDHTTGTDNGKYDQVMGLLILLPPPQGIY